MKPDPDDEALMAAPRSYLSAHVHEFALMKDQKILEFRASFEEAVRAGQKLFGRGRFTVQQVSAVLAQLDAAADQTGARAAVARKPDPDYAALMAKPRDYLKSHANEFALMHQQQVISFYPTFQEAVTVGRNQFGRGEFTVQQVRTEPVQLGSIAMLMTN
jgi:hypothetical protein